MARRKQQASADKPAAAGAAKAKVKSSEPTPLIDSIMSAMPGMMTSSVAAGAWTYIDFWNVADDLPCLSLEWLFGGRGLLAGRIMQLRAKFSQGKSSLMYALYGMGQRKSDAICAHIETEGAPAPPDYVASFGCDPKALFTGYDSSLEDCFERLDTFICTIRGGKQFTNPQTGKVCKTKFDAPLDAAMRHPIMYGIDSLSQLGMASAVSEDVADLTNSAAPAIHSRKLREQLRNRAMRYSMAKALLILTSHETATIAKGKQSFGAQGDTKSALAQEALGIAATYGVDMNAHKIKDENGNAIGDNISLTTFKNKLSPRYRWLKIPLIWGSGFSFLESDAEFLLKSSASPLRNTDGTSRAVASKKGIRLDDLSDKTFRSAEDLLRGIAANEDYLMSLRERMRIRGFGFKFESDFVVPGLTPEGLPEDTPDVDDPVGMAAAEGAPDAGAPESEAADAAG